MVALPFSYFSTSTNVTITGHETHWQHCSTFSTFGHQNIANIMWSTKNINQHVPWSPLISNSISDRSHFCWSWPCSNPLWSIVVNYSDFYFSIFPHWCDFFSWTFILPGNCEMGDKLIRTIQTFPHSYIIEID